LTKFRHRRGPRLFLLKWETTWITQIRHVTKTMVRSHVDSTPACIAARTYTSESIPTQQHWGGASFFPKQIRVRIHISHPQRKNKCALNSNQTWKRFLLFPLTFSDSTIFISRGATHHTIVPNCAKVWYNWGDIFIGSFFAFLPKRIWRRRKWPDIRICKWGTSEFEYLVFLGNSAVKNINITFFSGMCQRVSDWIVR